MSKLIYAADDDKNIQDILESFLRDAGYDVKVFSTGDALFEEYQHKPCDLVVLDIMMPGTDGLAVCKKLRNISTVPIIILTAKESEMDYVAGITYGGDDYLIKPFRPSILVIRIKALLRRIEMERVVFGEEMTFGDVTYSGKDHAVFCRGKDIRLTMTELALFRHMMKHSDKAVPREELLNEVWGICAEVETRVTDETVRRIRKKLKAANSLLAITAIWGYGYRLEVNI